MNNQWYAGQERNGEKMYHLKKIDWEQMQYKSYPE